MESQQNQFAGTEGQGAPSSTSGPRKRGTAACRLCRQRKVRCSLALTGSPCLNCIRDSQDCEVESRKKRTTKVARRPSPETSHSHGADADHKPLHSKASGGLSVDDVDDGPSVSTGPSSTGPSSLDTLSSSVTQRGTPKEPEEEYSVGTLTSALMKDQEGSSRTGTVPFYAGEQHGIGYILDILIPGASSRSKHYSLPRPASSAIPPENLAFLQAKGVFSLPSRAVCEACFQAYFHHVHPILPVVDAEAVLSSFVEGGAKQVNIMLLWSIFSVAANFVDDDVVALSGYPDRKEMKSTMFLRAKSLYDSGQENDKIVIIQSVSIMAFGFSDIEDKTESWHWMGIAIGLSQTVGLHHNPDRGGYNQRLTDHQRRLWRRIWWSCFFRDRWLSFGMGRPPRINIKVCDVPMASAEDVLSTQAGLDYSVKAKYIPSDLLHLAQRWVILLRLSKILGVILSKNYRPSGLMPTASWVKATEREASDCMADFLELPTNSSKLTTFYNHHLRLHYEAVIIGLWRPYEFKGASDISPEQSADWHLLAQQSLRTAASNTNLVLDQIIGGQMVRYMGPMTVLLLVPAMQTHLMEFKSFDPLQSQVGLNKLNLCMMVLNEAKKTFSSASFIYSIFRGAIERLQAAHQAALSAQNDKIFGYHEQQNPLPIEDYMLLSDAFWDTPFPFQMDSTLFDEPVISTGSSMGFDEASGVFAAHHNPDGQ